MTDDSLVQRLRLAATELATAVASDRAGFAARAAELDALIHEAEAREHRRAAFNARDASCYRLGSAFEPTDGLGLDPVALAGWLAMSDAGVLLLARQATSAPGQTVAASLAAMFASPIGRDIRAWGVWMRWHWLKMLYVAETETFLASPAARRPGWKRKPPSATQTYLIAEICTWLQKEPQTFATRGEAFAWILRHGGNPRFTSEPVRPDLGVFTGWTL